MAPPDSCKLALRRRYCRRRLPPPASRRAPPARTDTDTPLADSPAAALVVGVDVHLDAVPGGGVDPDVGLGVCRRQEKGSQGHACSQAPQLLLEPLGDSYLRFLAGLGLQWLTSGPTGGALTRLRPSTRPGRRGHLGGRHGDRHGLDGAQATRGAEDKSMEKPGRKAESLESSADRHDARCPPAAAGLPCTWS